MNLLALDYSNEIRGLDAKGPILAKTESEAVMKLRERL